MSGNRYGTIKPAGLVLRWWFSTAGTKTEVEETSFHEVSCATGEVRVVAHCHLSTMPLKWETIALHFAESISIFYRYSFPENEIYESKWIFFFNWHLFLNNNKNICYIFIHINVLDFFNISRHGHFHTEYLTKYKSCK